MKVMKRLIRKMLFPVLDAYLVENGFPLLLERVVKNTRTHQLWASAQSSADYISRNMATVAPWNDRDAGILKALSEAPKDGLVCEFGVYKAQSTNLIARTRPGTIHGFDSFEGLPEDWHVGYGKRAFALPEGHLPPVEKNVRLHVGLFDQTLPDFLRENPERAAFIHIDSDLYSSAAYVLNQLRERIGPGTVIVFDEYFNHPNWENGEFKAFQEFIAASGLSYEYLGYTVSYTQVAVRIL